MSEGKRHINGRGQKRGREMPKMREPVRSDLLTNSEVTDQRKSSPVQISGRRVQIWKCCSLRVRHRPLSTGTPVHTQKNSHFSLSPPRSLISLNLLHTFFLLWLLGKRVFPLYRHVSRVGFIRPSLRKADMQQTATLLSEGKRSRCCLLQTETQMGCFFFFFFSFLLFLSGGTDWKHAPSHSSTGR